MGKPWLHITTTWRSLGDVPPSHKGTYFWHAGQVVDYIEVYKRCPYVSANIILVPAPLANFVFSVDFHFYLHLWLHLWPVHRWLAVEALCQANILLEEVDHRFFVIFYQRASSKLECTAPLQLPSIRLQQWCLSLLGMADNLAPYKYSPQVLVANM